MGADTDKNNNLLRLIKQAGFRPTRADVVDGRADRLLLMGVRPQVWVKLPTAGSSWIVEIPDLNVLVETDSPLDGIRQAATCLRETAAMATRVADALVDARASAGK